MMWMISKTGKLPRILILDDIARLSSYPILGGGFADIWQGKLSDGTKVALKVLRLFSNTEEEKTRINKVGSTDILAIGHILILMNEGISFRGHYMVTAATPKHSTVPWGMHHFI